LSVGKLLTSGTQRIHVFSFGDSTEAGNQSDWLVYMSRTNPLGFASNPTQYLLNTHYTVPSNVSSGGNVGAADLGVPNEYTIAQNSTISGKVNDYAGIFYAEEITILNGQTLVDAAPFIYDRIFAGPFGPAANRSSPAPWIASTAGKDLTAFGLLKNWGASGITSNFSRLDLLSQYAGGHEQAGAAFLPSNNGTGLTSLSTTLAGASNDGAGVVVQWYAAAGDTTPIIGQSAAYLPIVASLAGNGSIIYALGIGGWCVEGFNVAAVCPPFFWNTLLPAYVGADQPFGWFDIGTNNPFNDTSDVFAAQLTTAINTFRAGFGSTVPILLTSAHPNVNQILGTDPYFVTGMHLVSQALPKVEFIDTWNSSPTYTQGQALGYYADTVHYNATGNAFWMTNLNSLL
jgi:hypothetical protein